MTKYLDGFQYENNLLQFVPTAEGYYDFANARYVYNYTDHLGNVRLSYFKNPSTGSIEVLEENNYYPFGLKHEGYNILAGNQSYNYKYNGKELQETGMYDYGARFYMPDIGRWGVPDLLAEEFSSWTPYNYAENNPIYNIDPDGNSSIDFSEYYKSSKDSKEESSIILPPINDNRISSYFVNSRGNTVYVNDGLDDVFFVNDQDFESARLFANALPSPKAQDEFISLYRSFYFRLKYGEGRYRNWRYWLDSGPDANKPKFRNRKKRVF